MLSLNQKLNRHKQLNFFNLIHHHFVHNHTMDSLMIKLLHKIKKKYSLFQLSFINILMSIWINRTLLSFNPKNRKIIFNFA